MKNSVFGLIFIVLCSSFVQAQKAIVATGGNAMGNGGAVSYSVGQISFSTNSSAFGSLAQGVQQPYEISSTINIDEAQIDLIFSAYPNPANEYLNLTVDVSALQSKHKMNYMLYDINGKLLKNGNIEGTETKIYMNKNNQGIYFLKVLSDNKEIKSFKIIKN